MNDLEWQVDTLIHKLIIRDAMHAETHNASLCALPLRSKETAAHTGVHTCTLTTLDCVRPLITAATNFSLHLLLHPVGCPKNSNIPKKVDLWDTLLAPAADVTTTQPDRWARITECLRPLHAPHMSTAPCSTCYRVLCSHKYQSTRSSARHIIPW